MSDTQGLVKRNDVGQLLPGQTPSKETAFKSGNEVSVGGGRQWLSEEERENLRAICPRIISTAVEIIGNSQIPALARIKAIELILNYAYGTPQIATIVKYEVDLIIREYGLPPRHKLVDRHGRPLFKSRGQYKPSADLSSSLKRHQFIERMEQAYLRDDDEVDAEASSKLHPTMTTYEPPLRPT